MDQRNSIRYLIVLVFSLRTLFVIAQANDSIKITYIGNMGVLLDAGNQQILIDGLHEFYKKAYQPPPDTLVDQLISGKVGLVLNTHVHGDHFSAALTNRYLKENPNGYFVGSVQAKDSILAIKDNTTDQILSPQPEGRTGVNVSAPGYKVTAFAITHTNPRRHRVIENLGYLIEMNNKRILHIGDADINPRLFHEINFAALKIDIAILPDWFLYGNYGPQIVEEFIAPKITIATHISPGDPLRVGSQIKKLFPETILFIEVGQEVFF